MVTPLASDSGDFINKLLPYTSHYAQIGGYRMHYLDEGPREAPVLICLHGNPTWCFYYRHIIADLRDSFRIIVPDYLGCGLSDRTLKPLRAEHRIEHLLELIDQLGLKHYSFMMHDWGGSIGTGAALRRIEAVDRLIYLNTTLTETESLPRVIKTAASPWIGKWLTQRTRHFVKLATTASFGVYRKLPKEVRKGYLYPYQTAKRRAAIWDFVNDIPFNDSHPTYFEMLDLANKLPQFASKPVQIIWGLRDPCFHRGMLDKVAEHFRHADVLEIAEASHLVLEDAKEQVNRKVREFMSAPSAQLLAHAARTRMAAPEPEEANSLYAMARKFSVQNPDNLAAIIPSFLFGDPSYRQVSYRELFQMIDKYQRGLRSLGLAAEDKVLMLVPAGAEFLALTYAVFACGATPVFVDPGMGRKNLYSCIKQINPAALIGSPRAQLLRLKRKELFPNLKFHLTASDWAITGGPNLAFLKTFLAQPLPGLKAPRAAMIAFTSGATGRPKGVIFTNQMLAAQARIFSEVFGLTPGAKDLPLLPIFSIYSAALGVTSAFVVLDPARPLDLQPDRIVRVIEDLKIDYSFGSPTLWNKIAEYCMRVRQKLPSIRKIFMAGAPVPPAVLQRVGAVLEHGTAFTPYGATEALPVTLVSSSEILNLQAEPAVGGEIGTFVGHAIPGVELRVVRPQAQALSNISEAELLPPFEIGEVIVNGSNVSSGYFELPEADAASKITDRTGVWHRMGDLGYLDRQGNLYFCGRKVHAVTAQGRQFYSVPVERIFNQHEKVRRSALVALNDASGVGVVIEPHPQCWPESLEERQKFRAELLALAAADKVTAPIRSIFFHHAFPVDARHNAKIFRDQLSEWANAREQQLDRAA
ncbi:MAG: alpha/beta fold hydrolase [Oligoflexia bacterium]|nr:alpha/beta fold hydrolase [Oligoflexia bacterium]